MEYRPISRRTDAIAAEAPIAESHPDELRYWRLARDAAQGSLGDEDRAILDAHLTTCAGCRDVFDRFVIAQRDAEGGGEAPVELSGAEIAEVARELGLDSSAGSPSAKADRTPRGLWIGLAAALFLVVGAALLLPPKPETSGEFIARGGAVPALEEDVSFRAFCTIGPPMQVVGSIVDGAPARCPAGGAITLSATVRAPRWAGTDARLFLVDEEGQPVPGRSSVTAPLPTGGREDTVATALELNGLENRHFIVVVSWGRPPSQVRSLGTLDVTPGPREEK